MIFREVCAKFVHNDAHLQQLRLKIALESLLQLTRLSPSLFPLLPNHHRRPPGLIGIRKHLDGIVEKRSELDASMSGLNNYLQGKKVLAS
jgi:hypothetical protein